MVVGAAEIEKSSGALTVSETVVDWVADAPVPVTVTVTVPVGVAPVVVMVRVEDWPELIVAGLNDADAPLGRPEALNADALGVAAGHGGRDRRRPALARADRDRRRRRADREVVRGRVDGQ